MFNENQKIMQASERTSKKKEELEMAYYEPGDTYEYFDGERYYNRAGDMLRDPDEYNPYSEGYTPFGDE